jgi:hypothetical protein
MIEHFNAAQVGFANVGLIYANSWSVMWATDTELFTALTLKSEKTKI